MNDEDPRVAKVIAVFAKDKAFAPIVDEYLASKAAGGTGFGSRALRIDGKIFAFVSSKRQLVVKLPPDRVDAIVAAKQGTQFDPGHGRKMKGWAAITAAMAWERLVREACDYVRGASRARARSPRRRAAAR